MERAAILEKAEEKKVFNETCQKQEQEKLNIEENKRAQGEIKKLRIKEKERKKKEKEEKRQAEAEDFLRRQERVESIMAEKERQRIEETKKQDDERRQQEEEQRISEEKTIKELEDKSQKMKEEILMIDHQHISLKKRRCELVKERQEIEIKRNKALGNSLVVSSNDDNLVHPDFLIHSSEQTDLQGTFIDDIMKENEDLKAEIEHKTLGIHTIQGSDKWTKFYTGLPSWGVFLHVYLFLSPYVKPVAPLTLEDEFLLVLVRLRLGSLLDDLAMRFGISITSATRCFGKWLELMFFRLQFLIKWPSRDILERNMPVAFKMLYPRCISIIDCSEIFIETPSSFQARSKTYSNYKKHNTIKFLISVTPCGSISFLSKCWGGRVSDKAITQKCGFLNYVEPGDVILANHGFTVADDIAMRGARLEIPAFTRGKQ